ncbi:hypothetical protein ARMSODRAFT_981157 [Armillaria solidipes]|uniref:Uncharacterized protein n=1 Tax=Armillaria solidipes TaxID=1076256 RepID=A0A2H3BAZ5_9AGAR|nr:hypothetical protein ARMSODRAFT_981157 [Armillaria solidipes]
MYWERYKLSWSFVYTIEIERLTNAIKELGEQIYNLEDEQDRICNAIDWIWEDDNTEKKYLETIQATLKEKLSQVKAQLQETTEAYKTSGQRDRTQMREQSENALEKVKKKDEAELQCK